MTLREVLSEKLRENKKKNKLFSLRSFAKKLEISPSTLSEFLNGEHDLTSKVAAKIVSKLNLDANLSSSILENYKVSKSITNKPQTLSEDEFKCIEDWYHFAILSYISIPKINQNISSIALAFSLSDDVVLQALQRLVRLGLIQMSDDGKFLSTGKRFSTESDIPRESIRTNNKQILNLSIEAIEKVSIEKRDISNITFAIDPKKIPQAKKKIEEFQYKISKHLSTGKKTQVYNLAISFFPLTTIHD